MSAPRRAGETTALAQARLPEPVWLPVPTLTPVPAPLGLVQEDLR